MKNLNNYIILSVGIIIVLIAIMVIGETEGYFLSPSSQKEETVSDDLIVVGISQLGSESVWRTANTESIQSSLSRQNGFFSIFNNARQKQDNQIKTIRNYISQGVDYIVFAPVTEDGFESVLKEAKENNIPVILMDRSVNVNDKSLYVTHVGSNMIEEGNKAGKWLEDELIRQNRQNEEINIVVLQGTIGSSAQIGREKGFNEIAKENPNWNILEIANADFTTTKGKEEMTRLLNKYEDIDVVVSQNDDMTFGAVEALTEAGYTTGTDGKIAIVSFDGVRKALRMVRDGVINCDVECNPLQGEYVAEIINNLENGVPIVKINNIEEKMFTIYNVNGYINSRKY